MKNKGSIAALAVSLAAALILPLIFWNDPYRMHILILVIISIGLASSLNLITGFAGQLSFAHAAFYGIGAYTSALLSVSTGLSFWSALPLSALFSGMVGGLLGIPCLRLKGPYLAIATIGFQEMIVIVFSQWVSVTRGPMGITGIPKPGLFGYQFTTVVANYYLVLVLVLLILLVIYRMLKSKVGLQMIAVREDETPARSIGVNTTKVKMVAFMVSSAMAGAVGSFYAHYIGNIDPYLFNINLSSSILVTILAGGMGTMVGPLLGEGVLTILPEMLRFLQDYRMITYGVVIIFVIIFMPDGLMGLINKWRNRVRSGAQARNLTGSS